MLLLALIDLIIPAWERGVKVGPACGGRATIRPSFAQREFGRRTPRSIRRPGALRSCTGANMLRPVPNPHHRVSARDDQRAAFARPRPRPSRRMPPTAHGPNLFATAEP